MTNFVTVEARALKLALKPIISVVERRNTIPILSCALLTITNYAFTVTGTDLDISATVHVDVIEAGEPFSICIDARKLSDIAKASGVSPMRIERTETGVTITIDDAAIYQMPTLPAADFPVISGDRGALIEGFGNGSFAALLAKVKWCISTEETRYYLNGVAWEAKKDGLYFTATDGYKIAACRYAGDVVERPSRIIPRKAVGVIIQHLKSADVQIYEHGSSIEIVSPGMTLKTKLIDGTFPDWQQRVIPTEHKHAMKIQKGEVVTAINQATAILSERTRAISFAPKAGRLAIQTNCPEYGTASIPTSAAWADGAEKFGFNASYFQMMLANCHGEVELRMTDSSAPFSFHDGDETMIRVMMPMRV